MANADTRDNVGGRPTKKTPAVVNKLISALKMGATITQACQYARISTVSFYAWLDADEAFLMEVEAAQEYLNLASKTVVGQAIAKDKNMGAAQWWLDRHEFRNLDQPPQIQNNTINVLTMPADERRSFNEEFKKFIKSFYAPPLPSPVT